MSFAESIRRTSSRANCAQPQAADRLAAWDQRRERQLAEAVAVLVEHAIHEEAEGLYYVADVLTLDVVMVSLVCDEREDCRHDALWRRLAESLAAMTGRQVDVAVYRQAEQFTAGDPDPVRWTLEEAPS